MERAFDKNGLAAFLLDERRDLLGIVLLFKVGNQNVGALAGERDGDRPSDSAAPVMMARLSFRRPEPL